MVRKRIGRLEESGHDQGAHLEVNGIGIGTAARKMPKSAVWITTAKRPNCGASHGVPAIGSIRPQLAEDKHRVKGSMAIASRRIEKPTAVVLLVAQNALEHDIGFRRLGLEQPKVVDHMKRGRHVVIHVAILGLDHGRSKLAIVVGRKRPSLDQKGEREEAR
jgi:hypothetical protein